MDLDRLFSQDMWSRVFRSPVAELSPRDEESGQNGKEPEVAEVRILEIPADLLKGQPVRVFKSQAIDGLSEEDRKVDCRNWNGAHVEVRVTGSPTATLTIEGADETGNYLVLADPRATQFITADTNFDVAVGTEFVKARLANLSGTSSTISVVVTPFRGQVFGPASITIDLSATSPASATTTAGTPIVGIGQYRSMLIYASLQGATGGVLDIYLQVSPDGGTTWIDYAHFAQIGASAAAIYRVWTVSKDGQQTTLATVGTGTSPALAASTIVGGEWGDRIRTVMVGGVGTSAGAAQTIKCVLSR